MLGGRQIDLEYIELGARSASTARPASARATTTARRRIATAKPKKKKKPQPQQPQLVEPTPLFRRPASAPASRVLSSSQQPAQRKLIPAANDLVARFHPRRDEAPAPASASTASSLRPAWSERASTGLLATDGDPVRYQARTVRRAELARQRAVFRTGTETAELAEAQCARLWEERRLAAGERKKKLDALQQTLTALELEERRQLLETRQTGKLIRGGMVRVNRDGRQNKLAGRMVELLRPPAARDAGLTAVFVRQLTAFQSAAVVLDAGGGRRLFSLRGPEIWLGREQRDTDRGVAVYLHPAEAASQRAAPNHPHAAAPRVLLKVIASGRGYRTGAALAMPRVTAVAVLEDELLPVDEFPFGECPNDGVLAYGGSAALHKKLWSSDLGGTAVY